MPRTEATPLRLVSSLQANSAASSVLPFSSALAGRSSTRVKSLGAGSAWLQAGEREPKQAQAEQRQFHPRHCRTPTLLAASIANSRPAWRAFRPLGPTPARTIVGS